MTVSITFEELLDLVTRVLVRHGMSQRNAVPVATACVAAERDGAHSHGLFRVAGLVSSLRSGWVDGKAEPAVEHVPGSCVLRVDARNGFAQPALQSAAAPAIEIARSMGACLIAIRDSHHLAALWPDVEGFAREGLVAMAFVNSTSRMVPWGGRKPVYGTNPMAFAVPRGDGEPLVFDQASSAMAFGDVRLAARSGTELPPGAGVDGAGNPTTDAQAVVDGGALLPFGAHKGSSIAMMVEILAAALTGGSFAFEVDPTGHPGAETPRTGELVILIDPEAVRPGAFANRMATLAARLRDSGVTRLPGDRRHGARARSLKHGLAVEQRELDRLHALLAEGE